MIHIILTAIRFTLTWIALIMIVGLAIIITEAMVRAVVKAIKKQGDDKNVKQPKS